MKLRTGFSASRRRRNCSSAARGPSTSMKTPCGELLTQPARLSPVARRWTNGRNPTPCTAPRTVSFRRARSLAGPGLFTRAFCPKPSWIQSRSGGQPDPWQDEENCGCQNHFGMDDRGKWRLNFPREYESDTNYFSKAVVKVNQRTDRYEVCV